MTFLIGLLANPLIRKLAFGAAVLLALAIAAFAAIKHFENKAVAAYADQQHKLADQAIAGWQAAITDAKAKGDEAAGRINALQAHNGTLLNGIEKLAQRAGNRACFNDDELREANRIRRSPDRDAANGKAAGRAGQTVR
jgi:hypothetical protein